MIKKLNFQLLISYFGLFPFIFVILDKYFFYTTNEDTYVNFIINYTLIIIVFIGATNWDLNKNINFYLVIYGFLPSFIALIIFVLKSYYSIYFYIILFLINFIIFQTLFDYLLIYSGKNNKNPFYKLRLPLSTSIIFFLILVII